MLEKYCDILVIGTELPGLVTGAFLAKRGLSVQILETDSYSEHSNLPDPVCLTNVKSKLLRSILGRLNVPENTIQNLLHQETTLQVLFPKHRIDIFENPLYYEEEISREFPKFHEELKNFYETLARLRHQTDVNELFQHLLPFSWREKNHFKKFIKIHHLNEKNKDYGQLHDADILLKTYLDAQILVALNLICEEPFSHQVAELFNPTDGAVFSVVSGCRDLQKMLLDRISSHNGKIRRKEIIQKLLYRQGVFEGAELKHSQDSILAKYFIWNTSFEDLQTVLPNKWCFRSLRKKCGFFPTHFHWFTVKFKIEKRFIPDPMKKNCLVILDPKKELRGTNFLYLQLKDLKHQEDTIISVNFLLPKSTLKENSEFFQKYFEEIQKHLTDFLPFSKGHLKQVFPFSPDSDQQDLLFPLHEDDFEIFIHSAQTNGILQQDEKKFLDLFPLNFKTPAPNLFLSHPAIFAPFGLDAKLTLGLKITDIIWQETEKEKRRAMKAERRIA